MSFLENIKNSFKMLIFDEEAIFNISNNEDSTKYGLFTIIIAGLLMALPTKSIMAIATAPIILLITFFIGQSFYHFIAKFILGGQATGSEYFRTLSSGYVLYWFSFIPIIGVFVQMIAGFWFMIFNTNLLNKVHQLSWPKAIMLGLLPIVVMFALMFMLGFAFLGVLSAGVLGA